MKFKLIELAGNKESWRLVEPATGAVFGTVWRHVGGFSWCRWLEGGAHYGGAAGSIDEGKSSLLADIEANPDNGRQQVAA